MEKDFDQMVAESIMDTFYVPNPKFGNTETVCRYNSAVDCYMVKSTLDWDAVRACFKRE